MFTVTLVRFICNMSNDSLTLLDKSDERQRSKLLVLVRITSEKYK